MFFPYLKLTRANVANVNQVNNANAQNVAIGSLGVNQTHAQVQSNNAAIDQR